MTEEDMERGGKSRGAGASGARAVRLALDRWRAAAARVRSLPPDSGEEERLAALEETRSARARLEAAAGREFAPSGGDLRARLAGVIQAMGHVADEEIPLFLPPGGGQAPDAVAEALAFLGRCALVRRAGDGWEFALKARGGRNGKYWYPDRVSVLAYLGRECGAKPEALARVFCRGQAGLEQVLRETLSALAREGRCALLGGRWYAGENLSRGITPELLQAVLRHHGAMGTKRLQSLLGGGRRGPELSAALEEGVNALLLCPRAGAWQYTGLRERADIAAWRARGLSEETVIDLAVKGPFTLGQLTRTLCRGAEDSRRLDALVDGLLARERLRLDGDVVLCQPGNVSAAGAVPARDGDGGTRLRGDGDTPAAARPRSTEQEQAAPLGEITAGRVLACLEAGPCPLADIEGKLCSCDGDRKALADVLEELRAGGRVRARGGVVSLRPGDTPVIGRYTVFRGGIAVIPSRLEEPGASGVSGNAAVPGRILLARHERGIWPGDLVEARVPAAGPACLGEGHGQPRGVFVRLVKRGGSPVPVTLRFGRRGPVAVPVDPALDGWYCVSGVPEEYGEGSMVLALPREDAGREADLRFHGGSGDMQSVAVQERLVKLNHGVPGAFPDDVLAEAAGLPAAPSAADMEGRRDLRDLPFVTIDGASARDFDDAVEVEGRDGGWLLRVAIADVSHYVRPGSALDREALERGNSWYFPTSVEPMLPEALSSGLCSLVPGEDRLVMWVEIVFDANGRVLGSDMGPGVIRSFARLTYDGVRDALLSGDGAALAAFRAGVPRVGRVLAMLDDALGLYRVLRGTRAARGSLDFDIPEPEPSFDGRGRVTALRRAARHDIHRLIEEFMIAANEAVARRMEASGQETLYRVHPAPDEEKLAGLSRALAQLGVTDLGTGGRLDLRGVLARAEGTPSAFMVSRLCVRAMQQARYERGNGGHFGLASDAYCHFTSPIRRYADLVVHRTLKRLLGMDAGRVPEGRRLDRVADQVNARERAAMESEREMGRRLACLWIARQPGRMVWHGRVCAVMPFGAFVEFDDAPVEGLVHVARMGAGRGAGDYFTYDERGTRLVGLRSGMSWHVGLGVTVRCARADIVTLQIDLEPVGVDGEREGAGRAGRAGAETARAASRDRRPRGKCAMRPSATGGRTCRRGGEPSRPGGHGGRGGDTPRDGRARGRRGKGRGSRAR